MNDRIINDRVWFDASGKPIQAHGGSIFYENETYYWYGENKEHTTGGNGVWHWGVRCYSSRDLYNWRDEGLIIPPDEEHSDSPLHPSAMMDRPHIIYNRRTKKYVCWLKIMQRGGEQTETVLTADRLLGPYTIVRTGLRPLGMSAGDFDLAVAEDGKAYYFFERVHSETVCADLTDDYTNVTGFYSTHFPHPYPPYVREATAHFVRNHKHYLITSGTTGYMPNPSEVAVADTWHGPYAVQGDPCVNDGSQTTFHSQISSVFKVPGKKDLYIACADRWVPNGLHIPYDYYREGFEYMFTDRRTEIPSLAEKYGISEADAALTFSDMTRDTSIAQYIWLPLRFEGDRVRIDWRDEWTIEEYE